MSKKLNARLAGLIYLVCVLTGIFCLAYVPSQLGLWANPTATTITNIRESEFLFRLSIIASVVCYLSFYALPFVLYKLLNSVNKNVAIAMVALAVVSIPISFMNLVGRLDVLSLISGAQYLDVFTTEQLNSQIILLLKSYNNGIKLLMVFWGLWLFPFGYLIYKSGFIPRVFGILLMAGCFSYLIRFTAAMLFPEMSIPSFVRLPASFGEIGTCLWLLIMGAKEQAKQTIIDKQHSSVTQ